MASFLQPEPTCLAAPAVTSWVTWVTDFALFRHCSTMANLSIFAFTREDIFCGGDSVSEHVVCFAQNQVDVVPKTRSYCYHHRRTSMFPEHWFLSILGKSSCHGDLTVSGGNSIMTLNNPQTHWTWSTPLQRIPFCRNYSHYWNIV